MIYTFTGPSFAGLFPGMAMAAGVGKLYQSIAKTDTSPIYILVIRQFADFALYQSASFFFAPRGYPAVIYAVTNMMVNCWALGVLLQKELIGIIGTVVIICVMAIEFFAKTHDFSKYRSA